MIRLLAPALALLLAACGVDGQPVPPEAATSGSTVSGEASFGVTLGG
jgi:hypothetical protein